MNRIFKTLVSGITTLSLCISTAVVMPVSAVDSTFGGGTGTEDNPYVISTAEHLSQLAADVNGGNNYSDKYFQMTNDITLTGEWVSIGTLEMRNESRNIIDSDLQEYISPFRKNYFWLGEHFDGIFDGGGYTVSGLSQDIQSNTYGLSEFNAGLFANNEGIIKNLSVSGNINIYVEYDLESWENSISDVDRASDYVVSAGGVVSCNSGTIQNCSYEGSITFSANDRNSVYDSDFSFVGLVGGITGYSDINNRIENCHNSADISVVQGISVGHDSEVIAAGGIAGGSSHSRISACYNAGRISESYDYYPKEISISGIVGESLAIEPYISSCYNIGSISAHGHARQIGGGNVSWCCYLDDAEDASSSEIGVLPKTSQQFASGDAAYFLNENKSTGTLPWYQTLGEDSLPVTDSSHGIVYYSESGGYSNNSVTSTPIPEPVITPIPDDGNFGGGTGTEDNPYVISTAEHLSQLAADVDGGIDYANKYFKVTNDITLSGNWETIGEIDKYDVDGNKVFSGVFDGGGYRIRGLVQHVNSPGMWGTDSSCVDSDDLGRGLFAINKGVVKNVKLNGDIKITGTDVEEPVGAIVSQNEGIVENCSFEGNIKFSGSFSGRKYVGGIAGNIISGKVQNCYNAANIDISGVDCGLICGGIIGSTSMSNSVTNCYNTGTITVALDSSSTSGTALAGGIAAMGDVTNCYNTGLITATGINSSSGPIVGDASNVINSYYLSSTSTSLGADDITLFSNDIALFAEENGAIAKTVEEFASGEVTYLLNRSMSAGGLAWYQTLGTDSLPGLDSSRGIVYYSEGAGYTNTYIAPEVTPGSTNRKIYIDFMGRGSTPLTESPGKAQLTKDDLANPEFWVGVAVDKVHDLPLFTDGIYSLELAFEYNPHFVEPYFETNNADSEWDAALKAGNLSSSNDTLFWNSDQYEIISVRETDIDTSSDRESKSIASERKDAGWKMCTICVTIKDGAAFDNARFSGLTDETKQYLLKLPFKLNAVPEESDPIQNPTVLSFVRGPATFDIGSGEQGINPYASWEATVTDPMDQTNLKNLFRFGGDISLFGSGGEVENIVVSKTDLKDGETAEDYPLSSTEQLTLDGFRAENLEYYVSVPNATEKIKLSITATDLPSVEANGTAINTTLKSDKLYETEAITLNEIDKTVAANGYNNTITVAVGDVTYTIYLRRLLEPRIELNPGNSPYGEIEKDDTIEDKAAAKDEFDLSMKLPSLTSLTFYNEAWKSYTEFIDGVDENGNPVKLPYNGDKDESSIFVYQRKAFKDPGFKLYDSLGDEVTDNNVINSVNLSLTMTSFKGGVATYDNADSPVDIVANGTGNNYIFTEFINANIRPDVYRLNYEFIDMLSGSTITATRYVIAISRLGDARIDANDIINNNDSADVKSKSGLLNAGNSIYMFKIADARCDANLIINNNDAADIKSKSMSLPLFYNYLPES